MGKKIIFIDDSRKKTVRCVTRYDYCDESFYIDYCDICKAKTRLKYPSDDTVIFSIYDDGSIFVRSRKHKGPSYNIRARSGLGPSTEPQERSLYGHIFEAFKIFDDINAQCKIERKDPVWMLEFDLDDRDLSPVLRVALTYLFDSFTLDSPVCDTVITKLHCDYHPSCLYNLMVKNLTKRDHKAPLSVLPEGLCSTKELDEYLKNDLEIHSPSGVFRKCGNRINADMIDPSDYWPESLLTEEGKALYNKRYLICSRGNGKNLLAQQLYRMLLNSTYGIKGGSNMDNKLYNFRKNIKEIKRDKKNPGKFLIDNKDGFLSREIVCDGFNKEELYSEEFIETILVIATQIQYDGIIKVIFNKEEKMTIIFPHNSYNFSERIIVKANGLDAFDILNGYSIAKAKMLCSGDGYQWYNKLRKSGKVDV